MTTKMYKAFVKSKETGELTIIESEYTSKKDFARDLRANGYAVKFISTPEKFDEDCENYHWELKRRKNIREAMKQHKASKEQDEQEAQEKAEENKNTFEYRNYIISGNERTGIIAIDNHGNFSPKVYKTVEEAKKAVDEDIEYAEKKYAEMEAEQTQADEAAETEPAKTPKSENVPYKMKWANQNVDYSRANYTAVIFKFNNSKVWLQLDCVCSTQTARATIRKLGKWFGSKSVDVKYFSDQTNEKIVSVCQLYDNSGYIFRNEIAVKNGEKRQFIKYAAKEIFE